MEEIKLYNTKDIQEMFGIHKNKAYALMNMDTFPSIKIGGQYFVEHTALQEWLRNNRFRKVYL